MPSVRPFTDAEYALVVLSGFRRMVRRTDLHLGFIMPRSLHRENADNGEIIAALQYAIDLIQEQTTTVPADGPAAPAAATTSTNTAAEIVLPPGAGIDPTTSIP